MDDRGAQPGRAVAGLADFGRDDVAAVGGKAANLGELVRAGFDVPPGFVVTTQGYTDFLAAADLTEQVAELAAQGPRRAADLRALFDRDLPGSLRDPIAAAYAGLGSPPVAVRSSATAEDGAEASFAGQQDTYLDVQGVEAVLTAVRSCWASLWTDRAMDYREHQQVEGAGLSLAVVVQEMVPAETAGVLFTVNPLNGRTEETLISAAPGLGEGVVSGTASTEQTVVERATHRVQRSPGPEPADPVITDAAAIALAELGERIEAHFGAPQDVEWARVGDRVHVLQSRPVTAVAPAEAAPPTDWSVPARGYCYIRGSIVEQLPDPLSPLFADLIDGAVTRSLTALMTELIGADAVRPGDLGLPTINGYAYYAYGWRGMLRITLRTGRALPVLGRGRRSGRNRWRTYARPRYQRQVAEWTGREPSGLAPVELLDGVVTLLDAGAEYYTSVQTIIPVAAMSEVAFSRFYTSLVRRPVDPAPATFLLGFDSLPIRAEKSLSDLAGWLRERPDLARRVAGTTSAELLADPGGGDDEGPDGWSAFRARLQAHLDAYGHTVYNLDVLNPVPADEPGPLVDALRFYLSGEVTDPYERQRRSVAEREEATSRVVARLDPARRQLFTRLLRWAQEAAPVREDALADVGLAWPQLRRLLAEAGRRLVALGVLDAPEDVFWLRWAEVGAALVDGDRSPRHEQVEARRRLWRGQRRVTPPQVLPARWAVLFTGMLPASTAAQDGDLIKGLAGSTGRVTAVARVLSGPADFALFQPGEVLVASVTTPAWTSLFGRAAAVVTDIGGPLSHSSIVAREYQIPAVLGTGAATKRIRTGQRVTVDGDAGTVLIIRSGPAADPG